MQINWCNQVPSEKSPNNSAKALAMKLPAMKKL